MPPKITVKSRRFVSADVCIEDGAWELTGVPADVPTSGLYTVVAVKRGDKWLMLCDRVMVPVK